MQNSPISLRPGMKLTGIINNHPPILLLLEHFGIDLQVGDKTLAHACQEKGIRTGLFIAVAQLFQGLEPGPDDFSTDDIECIIRFLKNCHHYYQLEKYPEILGYIRQLGTLNQQEGIHLLEPFFEEYFHEVKEHLSYEEMVAFPYITELLEGKRPQAGKKGKKAFSVLDYQEHHDDIQEKLNDIKNLLLSHLPIQQDQALRRKLMLSLLELEHDLFNHTRIEENILIPLVIQLEKMIPPTHE
jgi:regulator of cell morphogenesis and NO signaling